MISGSCHCGAIRIEIPHAPAAVTSCNCSICRRLGALWAFYPIDHVDGADTWTCVGEMPAPPASAGL